TGGETIVAFEAVAAGQAPARLVKSLRLSQALRDFLETRALGYRQFRSFLTRGVKKYRQVERFKRDDRVLCRLGIDLGSQEGIDVARGFFAVTDGRGPGGGAAEPMPAHEDTRMTGAHRCIDFDHVAAADADAGYALEKFDVRMLA